MSTLSAGAVSARRGGLDVALLSAGLGGAVAVRVALSGPAGPASARAGLAFAALLALLATAGGVRLRLDRRSLLLGLAGAVVLLAPVAARHLAGGGPVDRPGGYAAWAAATAVVATAEEALLRGALFAAVSRWRGDAAAVAIAAVAFAALHLPLYGWHAVPLDLAVGVGLGWLRLVTGTWTSAAVAHVGADLAGWWLL